MGTEIGILALYGLFVIVVILLQVLAALPQVGLVALASARDTMAPLTGVAARLDRAQLNCVIGLALFAPAAIAVQMLGLSTGATVLAGQIFLIARLVYVVVYAAGIPWLRTLAWTASILATAYLYIVAMGGAAAA
ncbi:MAG: MAPEG family protein [Pseudomonadota bacterium]